MIYLKCIAFKVLLCEINNHLNIVTMKQLRFRRVKEFNFSNNNMIIVTFVSETIARNTAIKILKDTKLDVSVHNNMLTIIVSNITYSVTVNEFGYFVEFD